MVDNDPKNLKTYSRCNNFRAKTLKLDFYFLVLWVHFQREHGNSFYSFFRTFHKKWLEKDKSSCSSSLLLLKLLNISHISQYFRFHISSSFL